MTFSFSFYVYSYEINKINKCILVVIVRAHACFLYVFDAVFVLRIGYMLPMKFTIRLQYS